MKTAIKCCFWCFLIVGSYAMAQRMAPQSNQQCGGVQAKAAVNWSQFHFDPCHTGYNPYETILSPSNVGKMVLAWKYHPQFDSVNPASSPAIADGVLYFGSGDNGYVYALNARTGAWLWTASTGYPEAGSPAVAYGNVYVPASTLLSGRIFFFSAATGSPLSSGGDVVPLSAVTVSNGAVYDASQYDSGYSHFGSVYALDPHTGELLWRDSMQYGVGQLPAVAKGVVYVGCDAGLCALNADTGAVLWQYTPPPSYALFSPAVSNGIVYLGASKALDIEGYSYETYLYALDAATGALLWQSPIGIPPKGGETFAYEVTPAVADGIVYIGTSYWQARPHCYMYALDARTGASLWSYQVEGEIQSSPAVANGVVYFGSDGGYIYALDAHTGALLWKYGTGNALHGSGIYYSSPAVANGMLYIGVGTIGFQPSYMYAFHLPF